jgi:hypothetical protein
VLAELGAQKTALNALEHPIAELKHGMPVEKAALAGRVSAVVAKFRVTPKAGGPSASLL